MFNRITAKEARERYDKRRTLTLAGVYALINMGIGSTGREDEELPPYIKLVDRILPDDVKEHLELDGYKIEEVRDALIISW